ncbi:hypothetical protein MMPV_009957 [Pyropia vietnamensis]
MAPSTRWTVADLESQAGKTVIVTGGNSGVGYESALHLARKGAHVTIAVRSMERGEAAAATIRQALAAKAGTATGSVTVAEADMSDQASVAAFAEAFMAEHSSLDVLLNNAGVMMLPRSLTKDGQELQLATNHLGHFALTGRLLPLLTATPGSRIVNVSSPAHRGCKDLSFDDWTLERSYTPIAAYARSKLANLLFTRELARRLAARGGETPVLAVTAQPGWAQTSLADKATLNVPMTAFMKLFGIFLSHSAESGACPLLYAATEADVRPDDYWSPSLLDLKGPPAAGKKSAMATDDAAAAALWVKSEEITGVSYLG